MARYFPHTEVEVREMLSTLGAKEIDDLFSDIPAVIRRQAGLHLPAGRSEYRVYQELSRLASLNRTEGICFLGCGSYDHVVPAVVHALASRGEFLTSYTPYQPEISQGVLQTIFEFQTMIAELTGLDVSNASLYDGATAAVEAAVIALNNSRKGDTILYSQGLHPATKKVLATFFFDQPVRLIELAAVDGILDLENLEDSLDERTAGVLIQSPNIYGLIEPARQISDLAHRNGSLSIISANPMSLALLASPGELGADLAVGDTQPLGLPPNYGGPSAGFIAARKKFLRKLPGRIAGESVDGEGKRAFVLTLQAREQHIKRQRATSNICSNQALAAVMNTIYLGAVGPDGLKEAARQSAAKARYLADRIRTIAGWSPLGGQNFFNEFTLELPFPARELMGFMEERGIWAGVDLSLLQTGRAGTLLTVAVTEKRSLTELDRYAELLMEFLSGREERDDG